MDRWPPRSEPSSPEEAASPSDSASASTDTYVWPPPPDEEAAQVEPAREPDGRPKSGRRRRVVVGAAIGAVVLLAAGAGVAYLALRGSPDRMAPMVPADATVYATVYLDPSAGQKVNVVSLAGRFPALEDEQARGRTIERIMDDLLVETGLTFARDVRPWLGTQIGVAARIETGSEAVAVLIDSMDDAAARAALAKARATSGEQDSWTERSHSGVSIFVGRSSDPSADPNVYAFVDGTVVLADDVEMVEDIVDASQGSAESLSVSRLYTETIDPLPGGKLGLLYVNLETLVAELDDVIDPAVVDLSGGIGKLDAFRGLGLSVSAEQDGVAMDFTVLVDPGKLDPEERESLESPLQKSRVLAFVPEGTYLLFAENGFQRTVEDAIVQLEENDPSFAEQGREIGLTGPDGAIQHLTGDFAFELEPGSTLAEIGPDQRVAVPAGAFLIGTGDEPSATRVLDNLAQMLVEGTEFVGPETGASFTPRWETDEYRGVTISFLRIPDLEGVGVIPSYAITEGVAIVASSPQEARAVIDAKADEAGIASVARFRRTVGDSSETSAGLLYVDVEAVARAIRESLTSPEAEDYDEDVAPNLDPVKAFGTSSTASSTRVSGRLFVLIE
jgi:hypothetical protein